MIDKSYINVLENIKQQIKTSQHKAILNANKEIILMYWNIGKIIEDNIKWGNKFIEIYLKILEKNFQHQRDFQLEI